MKKITHTINEKMVNIRSDNPKCNNKCKCNNNLFYHYMVTYNLIQVWDGCVPIHCCLASQSETSFSHEHEEYCTLLCNEHTWTRAHTYARNMQLSCSDPCASWRANSGHVTLSKNQSLSFNRCRGSDTEKPCCSILIPLKQRPLQHQWGGWRAGAGVRSQRAHVSGKSRPLTFCRPVLTAGPSQDSMTTGTSVKTNNPHFMFHCKFVVNPQKTVKSRIIKYFSCTHKSLVPLKKPASWVHGTRVALQR